MARIAGLVADLNGKPPTSEEVRAMLAPFSQAEPRFVAVDGACFAVAGPGGGVAADGDLILALDGRLFDDGVPPGALADHDDAGRLLTLCRERGLSAALAGIEGDLAVAVYDRTTRRLALGRDRFGVRPLYHASPRGRFAFCSLPAPLARLEGVGMEVNRRFAALIAGSHYRTFDNEPRESPFHRVGQVPAAQILERPVDGDVRISRYWTLSPASINGMDEAALAERLRELLAAAVGRRLSATLRPAFTLSGGMDSSSVVATAGRLLNGAPEAFSSIYDDPLYDERNEIRDVIDAGLARWNPVRIADDVDVLGAVHRLVRVHNEPVATATWLAHDFVCRDVVAAGHTALFGGLGGDELNAGEYEYFPMFFAELAAEGRDAELDRELIAWAHYHDHPVHQKSPAIGRRLMDTMTVPGSAGLIAPDLGRTRRYASAVSRDFFDIATYQPIMEHPFPRFLANRAYQDLTRETTPCCLRAEDRHASAHGIERFDPFLDTALVEFMFAVPARMKIRNGVTKHLLRQATEGLLPEATRLRVKKTGWNAPAHVWFARREGIEALRDLVSARRFRERGLYIQSEVERIVEEHAQIVSTGEARENHMMFLWQLVNLDLWLDWVEHGMSD